MAQAHNDDISSVLILNKKSISNHEQQLFQAELEKFRPHQTRILQSSHKQNALMKELRAVYSALLQDKRVRAEQSKYETVNRQRNTVMTRYRKVYQAFNDLKAGLLKAQQFYSGMKENVDSLEKNVEAFVNNRRSEGAHLLSQIEKDRLEYAGGQAERERERLRELMERMSMEPSSSVSPSRPNPGLSRSPPVPASAYQGVSYPATSPPMMPRHPSVNHTGQYAVPNSPPPVPSQSQLTFAQHQALQNGHYNGALQGPRSPDPYVPSTFTRRDSNQPPLSSPGLPQYYGVPSGHYAQPGQYPPPQQSSNQYIPPDYVPPPPPPGPPPLGPQQTFPTAAGAYGAGANAYAHSSPPGQRATTHSSAPGDPWAGLNAWR